MERNEVQKEVESGEEVVSRKARTGIIKKEDQVLKESMVDGSAEAWHLGMRAEPFILKGGVMKSRLAQGSREGSSGEG